MSNKTKSQGNLVISVLVAVVAFVFFAYFYDKKPERTAGSTSAVDPNSAELPKEVAANLGIISAEDDSNTSRSLEGRSPSATQQAEDISVEQNDANNDNIGAAPDENAEELPEDLMRGLNGPPPELPPEMKAQLKMPPPELPEDLRRQLEAPKQELPEDLKAQMEAPAPPLPDDIKRALATPPRIVTLDEVNTPPDEGF